MPLISSFYGLVVKMYFDDKEHKHIPHFHTKYNGKEAVFSLNGKLLAGKLPPKQKKLVLAWIEIHKEELKALWDLMQETGEYFQIKGLE